METAAPVRRLPRTALVPAGVAVAATAVFLLVGHALIDDAYITMAYARNLAFHLHWGLIADETANSATSPLNVIALGVVTAVVRDGVVAVGVLFVGSAVLAAHWLSELAAEAELPRVLPVVAVGSLLVNPLLLSTVGLEPFLTAALWAGLLRYGVARRPVAFGVVAGLAVLARPDMAVVVLVAALVLRPGWGRALGAALAVALPWYAFSWFVLGSALPDTLVMKVDDAWGAFDFGNGPLLYLGIYPATTTLAFVPVLVGLAVLVGLLLVRPRGAWARAAVAAGLGAVAHYGAYCLLHTAPYHWYYAPLIVGTTLCAAIVAARVGSAVPVAAGMACVALVVDVAHGLPWERAAIATNWATAAEYQRMGADLRGILGPAAVESPGEIGTLAYYCACTIVDAFSDRGHVIGAIEASEQTGGLGAVLLQLNYLHLDRAAQPRRVDDLLRYQAHQPATASEQWPVDHWVDGPGRIVLIRPR